MYELCFVCDICVFVIHVYMADVLGLVQVCLCELHTCLSDSRIASLSN